MGASRSGLYMLGRQSKKPSGGPTGPVALPSESSVRRQGKISHCRTARRFFHLIGNSIEPEVVFFKYSWQSEKPLAGP